jgi:transposase InsO family protein
MGKPGSCPGQRGHRVLALDFGVELRRIEHSTTRAAARAKIAAWIEAYNTTRRHSAVGMKSRSPSSKPWRLERRRSDYEPASPAFKDAPVLGPVQVVPPRA